MHCRAYHYSKWLKHTGGKPALAVTVRLDGSAAHVELLVRSDEGGKVRRLHFWAAPKRAILDEDEAIHVLPIPVKEGRMKGALITLRLVEGAIYDAAKGIDSRRKSAPYSVAFNNSCQLNNIIGFSGKPDAGDGFTCASFVADFLQAINLQAVKKETWQPRDGDAEWQKDKVAYLRAEVANDTARLRELDAQEARADGRRLYPEEVAAAAACHKHRPLDFHDAEVLGKHLRQALQHKLLNSSYCPKCPPTGSAPLP